MTTNATATETTATETTVKAPAIPKYNVSLDPALTSNLDFCAGKLDLSRAEVFRRALAHYRQAVESGAVQA